MLVTISLQLSGANEPKYNNFAVANQLFGVFLHGGAQ